MAFNEIYVRTVYIPMHYNMSISKQICQQYVRPRHNKTQLHLVAVEFNAGRYCHIPFLSNPFYEHSASRISPLTRHLICHGPKFVRKHSDPMSYFGNISWLHFLR